MGQMDMIYQNQMINLPSQPLLINTNDSMHHHNSSTNNNNMTLDESTASQLNQQMPLVHTSNDGSESSTSNEENVSQFYLLFIFLISIFSHSSLQSKVFMHQLMAPTNLIMETIN